MLADYPKVRIGIGQDSHRFLEASDPKACVIGGVIFKEVPGLSADSDGDVIFHAICNAITSLAHVPILGKVAIDLCKNHYIVDSKVYVQEAMKTLGKQVIQHLSLSLEGQRPKLQARMDEVRQNIATVMQLDINQVGITVTSGDGLTAFGRGEGLQCFCLLTTVEPCI